MNRIIVITNELRAEAAINHLRNNWQAMIANGRPMEVKFYEHRDRRSLEQQAAMWFRLKDIADQVWVDGRTYSDVVWHEHLKAELLPEEDGPSQRAMANYKKWAILPDGERRLIGSTTQLTAFGMGEYLTQLEAWGSGQGVRFSANPNEGR